MESLSFARSVFDDPSRTFAVELWDGNVLEPPRGADGAGRVVLRDEALARLLVPPVSERAIAEAFVNGDLDIEGDTAGLLEAAARWRGPRLRPNLVPSVLRTWLAPGRPAGPGVARLCGRRHSKRRDRRAIRHHYDLSDDFYKLFLDADMVYSCAYFPTGTESLEDAQKAKLDLVCAKLDLQPGDRLLDVGCGWGALVVHAASRYGAAGIGITLSEKQAAEARRRLAELGGGSMEVRLSDYRELGSDERFDKVASVGMMEHVGRSRLGRYFAVLHRTLRPGGLLLNHAIADTSYENTLPWASRQGGGFIDRYIFPDGELLPIGEVVQAAERAGFEVRDLESLREHYALTLSHWLTHLEERFDEAMSLVGIRAARAFRLYLASSVVAFRLGRISVFQLLLAKRTHDGRARGLPTCRSAWYRRSRPGANGDGRPPPATAERPRRPLGQAARPEG